MRRLVLCLIWLAIVNAENQPEALNKAAVSSDSTTKTKRFLNHGLSHGAGSPCPPFYPHFHEPKPPMYFMKPYGPPAYPKPVYGAPMSSHHHAQFIHQPTYSSYVPKQTISYVKSQVPKPHYNYLPSKPAVTHQVQPFQQLIMPQAQWQYPAQVNYHQKPHFAYAPAYHTPMLHQVSYEKPANYHAALTSSNVIHKPGIVYKSDSVNCVPCHQASHQLLQHPSYPQAIHVQPSYVKPIIQQAPAVHPAPIYLPAHSHVQPIGHVAPCHKE